MRHLPPDVPQQRPLGAVHQRCQPTTFTESLADAPQADVGLRPAFPRIPWRSTFKPMLACDQRVICRALPSERRSHQFAGALAGVGARLWVCTGLQALIHARVHTRSLQSICMRVQVCMRVRTHTQQWGAPTGDATTTRSCGTRTQASLVGARASRHPAGRLARFHRGAMPTPAPLARARNILTLLRRHGCRRRRRALAALHLAHGARVVEDVRLQSARYHEPARVKGACMIQGVRSPRKLRAGRSAAQSWS